MKANELMVGDLVYAIDGNGEKHPCRVNDLRYDYINKRDDFCVDFYGTEYDPEWPDVTFNVEPIPLTTEILDKNFRGYKLGSGALAYFVYELNEDYFICASAGSINLCMHYDDSEHAAHDDIYLVKLMYVHTLQHALRLFGFDKEIVL